MGIYYEIYINLCESRKANADQYKKGSGLHKHRIIPGHEGGKYNKQNVTYLTVREHVIAHFLLYKISKNPNDLRSMHMLGCNLTVEQRRTIGKFCYENKIGFHKLTAEQRVMIGKRVYNNHIINQTEFAFWASKQGRSLRASMGGRQTKINGTNRGFHTMDKQSQQKLAIKGNRAQPKKPATNGLITKKFHTDQQRDEFIAENFGWRCGVHW